MEGLHWIVDIREADLLRELGVGEGAGAMEVRALDVGDVMFVWNGEERWICERKTAADWVASIKDGRYKEQKVRLRDWQARGQGRRRVWFVIEGPVASWAETGAAPVVGITKSAWVGSILNTMFRDGFTVVFTKGVSDTADCLRALARRFAEEYADVGAAGPDPSTGSYIDQIQLRKQKNLTPENALVFQLAQIPGVSTTIASAIARVHGSMRELIDVVGSIETEKERARYVQTIPVAEVGVATVKGRKSVGPKTAATILEYLGF